MLIRIIIDLLIAVGLVFACAGTIGIIKMPDPFSRMQAATCTVRRFDHAQRQCGD